MFPLVNLHLLPVQLLQRQAVLVNVFERVTILRPRNLLQDCPRQKGWIGQMHPTQNILVPFDDRNIL